MAPKTPRVASLSRRSVLKKGVAAVGSGAVAILSGDTARAAHAASQQTSNVAGRKFRAFVRHGSTASVEELRLLPISGRQVVVRTQASQCCYTITAQALATTPAMPALVPGHG